MQKPGGFSTSNSVFTEGYHKWVGEISCLQIGGWTFGAIHHFCGFIMVEVGGLGIPTKWAQNWTPESSFSCPAEFTGANEPTNMTGWWFEPRVGMMKFPIYGEKNVPNHQPDDSWSQPPRKYHTNGWDLRGWGPIENV